MSVRREFFSCASYALHAFKKIPFSYLFLFSFPLRVKTFSSFTLILLSSNFMLLPLRTEVYLFKFHAFTSSNGGLPLQISCYLPIIKKNLLWLKAKPDLIANNNYSLEIFASYLPITSFDSLPLANDM